MAMTDHGGPAVDLYQLLGVRREALDVRLALLAELLLRYLARDGGRPW